MSLAQGAFQRVPVAAVIVAAIVLGLVATMAIRSALGAVRAGGRDADVESAIRLAVDTDASREQLVGAAAVAVRELVRNPASAKPLVVAAQLAERRGDGAAAIALMEQTVARDPRDVEARMWLTARYLRAGQFALVVRHLDAVMRIRPRLRRELVGALIPLVSEPVAREAIARALLRKPVWAADFLDLARRDARIAAPFYALVYALGAENGFQLADGELTGIVVSALARGDYQAARALYGRFVQRTDADPANLIADGDFRGVPGPAPFNWTLNSTAAGFAKIESVGSRGRMVARTFAAEPARLASQTVLLSPGDYVLATSGAADGATGIDGLGWTVTCERSGVTAARLAVSTEAARFDQQMRFAVPDQCRVAQVALEYMPTDRGTFAATMFDRVALIRSGGVQ